MTGEGCSPAERIEIWPAVLVGDEREIRGGSGEDSRRRRPWSQRLARGRGNLQLDHALARRGRRRRGLTPLPGAAGVSDGWRHRHRHERDHGRDGKDPGRAAIRPLPAKNVERAKPYGEIVTFAKHSVPPVTYKG